MLRTVVTGPVQRSVALVVCEDRKFLYRLGGVQQAPQHTDVSTGCSQVHGGPPLAVTDQKVGAVLQQGLHTLLMSRHRLTNVGVQLTRGFPVRGINHRQINLQPTHVSEAFRRLGGDIFADIRYLKECI